MIAFVKMRGMVAAVVNGLGRAARHARASRAGSIPKFLPPQGALVVAVALLIADAIASRLPPLVRLFLGLILRLVVSLTGVLVALHETIEPTIEFFGFGPAITRAFALVAACYAGYHTFERARQLREFIVHELENREKAAVVRLAVGITFSVAMHLGVASALFWQAA